MVDTPTPTPSPTPTPAPAGGDPAPAERPEYVPEKFWDNDKREVRSEAAFKSLGELERHFHAGGVDGLKADLKTQLDTERLAGRPAKADDYKLQLGKDVIPEGVEWTFDDKNPMLAWWREDCWKNGRTQAEFDEGVNLFVGGEVGKVIATSDALQAEFTKLGEHGKARVDYLTGRIANIAGEAAVETLAPFLKTAASVEAMEAIIKATGGPGFQMPAGDIKPKVTLEELKAIQAKPEYYRDRNPELLKQVEDGYKALYPGQHTGGFVG